MGTEREEVWGWVMNEAGPRPIAGLRCWGSHHSPCWNFSSQLYDHTVNGTEQQPAFLNLLTCWTFQGSCFDGDWQPHRVEVQLAGRNAISIECVCMWMPKDKAHCEKTHSVWYLCTAESRGIVAGLAWNVDSRSVWVWRGLSQSPRHTVFLFSATGEMDSGPSEMRASNYY